MLTQTYRPRTFSEVLGPPFSLKLLKSIAKNPEKSPRSLIFSGTQGSGKTSCARIFPKAINCERNSGDACNACSMCSQIDEVNTGFYIEYNCAHTGSAETIRDLQDSFSYSFVGGKYRVIAFDEIHLSSTQAQSALLKPIEEAPTDLFFIFCTTDPHQIIDTIRSRSLEIVFGSISPNDILELLRKIVDKEGIQLSNEVMFRISRRCKGDVRSAIHMLEEAIIIGETEFLNHVVLLDKDISTLLDYAVDPNVSVDEYKNLVAQILLNPVEYIRSDFERVISLISRAVYVDKISGSGRMELIVVEWLKNQRYLGGRNDWQIFFNSLRRFVRH